MTGIKLNSKLSFRKCIFSWNSWTDRLWTISTIGNVMEANLLSQSYPETDFWR